MVRPESFNPTRVRLKRVEAFRYAVENPAFNPTRVRLKRRR